MKNRPWKDTTSHSRSATDRTPRDWTYPATGMRIVIHRRRLYDPKTWFVSCVELCIEAKKLEAVDVDAAKAEALEFVRKRLRDLLAEVS